MSVMKTAVWSLLLLLLVGVCGHPTPIFSGDGDENEGPSADGLLQSSAHLTSTMAPVVTSTVNPSVTSTMTSMTSKETTTGSSTLSDIMSTVTPSVTFPVTDTTPSSITSMGSSSTSSVTVTSPVASTVTSTLASTITLPVTTLLLSTVTSKDGAIQSSASSTAPVTPTEDESSELVDWLTRYGYLPPPDPSTGQLQAWTAVTHAVKAMQKFAGLKESGVLDEETRALIRSPRCSLPDEEGGKTLRTPANQQRLGRSLRRKRKVSMATRRKREVSAWTRRNINWRLRTYPPASSSLSRDTIRSLVFYALRVWAEPTPLEFHEVAGPETADLQVDFLNGFHGDGYPFDGAGGAVGHAFFPSDPTRAGGVHLDAAEDWAFRQPASEGTDLFTVLVHEFGHALGLSHSSSRQSVMRPYYHGPAGDPLLYRLGNPDEEHITKLYGKKGQELATNAPRLEARLEPEMNLRHHEHRHHRHSHSHRPSIDRCNTSFDAVAQIRGETFFFKGSSMWRVSAGGLVSGRGAHVRRLWGGLPPDVPRLQAVLERHRDHAIIFIGESRFWLFRDLSLQQGYPRPLSELREVWNETNTRTGTRAVTDGRAGTKTESGVTGAGVTETGVTGTGAGSGAGPGPVVGDSAGPVTVSGCGDEIGRGAQGLVWNSLEGPMWGEVREEIGEEEEDATWSKLIRDGVNGITTETDGSAYLFKGHSYWKFPYPGSAPEQGYPRSVATDWLDCPQPSASAIDDISLSFSPPTRRQELREVLREERGREDKRKEERRGQLKDKDLDQARDRESLKHCTCLKGTAGDSGTPFSRVLLMTILPLLMM